MSLRMPVGRVLLLKRAWGLLMGNCWLSCMQWKSFIRMWQVRSFSLSLIMLRCST